MEQIIKKWGNSLAIRLPKEVAKTLNLQEGSKIEINVEKGKIVIRPKKDLKEILSLISPKNLHTEVDWGQKSGNEVW